MPRPTSFTFALITTLLIGALPADAQEPTLVIEDPTGDAGVAAATPAVWDQFDLVSVAFGDETEDAVTIHVATASPGTQPVAGEIAVHFEAAGAWWLIGWSTVAFPAPPFVYQGGFFCPSDPTGGYSAAECGSVPATFAADSLELDISRAQFGLLARGTTVATPSAYSLITDAEGTPIFLDETEVGGTYTFQSGPTPASNGTATPTATPTAVPDEPGAPNDAPAEPTASPRVAESPAIGAMLALSFLGAVLAFRTRRS